MEIGEYSLWLVPTEDVRKRLRKIINQLSDKYSSPRFEPHVTLIVKTGNEEEIILKTSQIIKQIDPFEIKLGSVDYLNEYFKCLFIRAKKNKELINSNKKAQKNFGANTGYIPQLSLMYGNFPEEIKKEIIKNTGKNFNIKFRVASILVMCTTSRNVGEWYKVKEFELK